MQDNEAIEENENIIEIEDLGNYLGGRWVHSDLNLGIKKGEILAIIGKSGCGKTTLLRNLLLLLQPSKGKIKIFNEDILTMEESRLNQFRQRFGILFQQNALFSSLNVLENILFPMQELTTLPPPFLKELAMLKLLLVGLAPEAANQSPSQLSGGMQKRAATARALAMDPEVLFLDEPTSGLDPKNARQLEDLMLFLRKTLGLTIVMVSHDLLSLKRMSDRVAFLGEGKVLAVAPFSELKKNPHPAIADYFKEL